MLSTLIVVLLGLALFAYVALPLINPRGADPLPSEKDPVTTDLEEEKEALFRAIRELDLREDLSAQRREQLRARYEAKAARVLRALDERRGETSETPAPRRQTAKGVPYGALALLGLALIMASAMGAWVLPRVGQGTVTTFFQQDLDAARGLRDLQETAQREPSEENLLALADAYWQAGDPQGVSETYGRLVDELGTDSALAYRRLGLLALETDLEAALTYLQRSRELDPQDLDTLYLIGEIQFALGDPRAAAQTWQAFVDAPGGEDDEQVAARLELAREVAPLQAQVDEDPSHENLLALADALWRHDERGRAADVYFSVVTQHDPNDPIAVGRLGQMMFLSGRNDDAILLMERAAQSERVDPETLLFLGNAYFTAEQYERAIGAWERHVSLVGEEAAGRVPSLIEDARARLSGEAGVGPPLAEGATDGQDSPLPGADFTPATQDPSSQDQGAGPAPGAASPRDELPGGAGPGEDSDAVPGSATPPAEADDDTTAAAGVSGAEVFAQNCSACHGPAGEGGVGPRLAGSNRAANESNVRNAVTYGRGMMPGFGAVLSQDELEAVIAHVTGSLAPTR